MKQPSLSHFALHSLPLPMDFRFRAIDNQPPAAIAAAASSSASSTDHPLQDESPNAELMKQRIREEIMIRDIASRRMLEAEIRRELNMEQELARLRATGQATEHFGKRLLDQRLNHSASIELSGVPGSSSSLNLSLPLPVRPVEMKPLVDESLKVTYLPKPDPEKFNVKRKAEGPPTEADPIPSTIISKKSSKLEDEKDMFTCTLCKVTATCETTFNDHLQGKKHKVSLERSRQHALRTRDDVLPEKTTSPTEEMFKGKLDSIEESALRNKAYYEYWCEICQIGTRGLPVMEMHNKGRKHRARVLKLGHDEQKEPLSGREKMT